MLRAVKSEALWCDAVQYSDEQAMMTACCIIACAACTSINETCDHPRRWPARHPSRASSASLQGHYWPTIASGQTSIITVILSDTSVRHYHCCISFLPRPFYLPLSFCLSVCLSVCVCLFPRPRLFLHSYLGMHGDITLYKNTPFIVILYLSLIHIWRCRRRG